jgi:hypothetical protein
MARELRRPVDTAEFNRLALTPIKKRLAVSWWNLRWAAHDKPGQLYFATVSGLVNDRCFPAVTTIRNRHRLMA